MDCKLNLYHVRGSEPSKDARTLRFRNSFQNMSCLIATVDCDRAVREWWARHITSTYRSIKKITFTEDVMQIEITNLQGWVQISDELNRVRAWIYTFSMDDRWDKHPTKDCYMTRKNVFYDKETQSVEFKDFILDFKIELVEWRKP